MWAEVVQDQYSGEGFVYQVFTVQYTGSGLVLMSDLIRSLLTTSMSCRIFLSIKETSILELREPR